MFQQSTFTLACLAALLLYWGCTVHAIRTLDYLRPVSKYARRTSDDQLKKSLSVSRGILQRHNRRLESRQLEQYINHLQQVLQQDCCDYFTALPLVKDLTEDLLELLDLKLPQELYPAVRRSYVASMWLLQRSKLFKWNNKYMHRAATLGFWRLYEAHVDFSAGRPISFHHISKSGGTSLCQLAKANGCKGPVMNKAANCLLNFELDGPTWVFKHHALTDNGLPLPPPPEPPPPPPPPPPPFTRRAHKQHHDDDDDDDDDDDEGWIDPYAPANDDFDGWDQQLKKKLSEVPPVHTYEWFMYECPKLLEEKGGYGCRERQEAAAAKSATFLANEHGLSLQHGTPQVCPAFTNLVMVRESLSEAVSLMGEVIQVYNRLLRRQSVNTWEPPRTDLAWWEKWAPVVISSYSTRTLLGAKAFCPPKEPAAALATAGDSSAGLQQQFDSSGPLSGSGNSSSWLHLTEQDMQTALQTLYTFDLVLELGSPDLVDISVSKLLGWSAKLFTEVAPQRNTPESHVLTWQQLECLARQQPPEPQKLQPKANNSVVSKAGRQAFDVDVARRMVAEAMVRRTFVEHGEKFVITPTAPGHKRQQPVSEKVVAAALQVLHRVNQSLLVVSSEKGAGGHVVVRMEEVTVATAAADNTEAGGPVDGHKQAVGGALDASVAISRRLHVFHVWPKHGVVLDSKQFGLLVRLTAADRLLHEHASLLQLLDAAWLTAVSRYKGYKKLLKDLEEDIADDAGCGYAGLNHMQ